MTGNASSPSAASSAGVRGARSSRARARGSRSRARAPRSRSCRGDSAKAAAPTIGKAQARWRSARSRSERSSTCSKRAARLRKRPKTVPIPQSAAAASVSTIGDQPVRVGSSGCGSEISQTPASAGSRNQRSRAAAARRARARRRPRDQRLHLLQHDDGDEVAVEERLREQDRRDRRGAGADGDPGCRRTSSRRARGR